jgi:hypothetical protein
MFDNIIGQEKIKTRWEFFVHGQESTGVSPHVSGVRLVARAVGDFNMNARLIVVLVLQKMPIITGQLLMQLIVSWIWVIRC